LHFLLTHPTGQEDSTNKWQAIPRFRVPGGQEVTNLEMAQAIAERLDEQLHYILVDATSIRPGYDKHYPGPDDSLTRLGFKPPLGLWDGLDWIKAVRTATAP
jgi:hypothetical protein